MTRAARKPFWTIARMYRVFNRPVAKTPRVRRVFTRYRYPHQEFMDLERYPVLRPEERAPRLPQHVWDPLKRLVHEESQWTCFYCSDDCGDDAACDHLIPLARGGSNERSNLVTSCHDCNTRKGILMPEEFYRLMGWWPPKEVTA